MGDEKIGQIVVGCYATESGRLATQLKALVEHADYEQCIMQYATHLPLSFVQRDQFSKTGKWNLRAG